jgi:hypothetical protein
MRGRSAEQAVIQRLDERIVKERGSVEMVVVTIEMWPGGDEGKKYPIGQVTLTNDGTGDSVAGNYEAIVSHGGCYFGRPGAYRSGKVRGFARALSPYHLLARALAACGIK